LAAVGAKRRPLRHKIDRAERISATLIRCSAGDDAYGVSPPSKENIPEFKSKAVLLPKREQFAFVLSILAKTDFHVSLLLAMLYYVKPCEWESHLISHSFLWLCSMQEFLLDQTPFILAAVAHPWIVSTKATYDVARRILCLTLSVVFW